MCNYAPQRGALILWQQNYLFVKFMSFTFCVYFFFMSDFFGILPLLLLLFVFNAILLASIIKIILVEYQVIVVYLLQICWCNINL